MKFFITGIHFINRYLTQAGCSFTHTWEYTLGFTCSQSSLAFPIDTTGRNFVIMQQNGKGGRNKKKKNTDQRKQTSFFFHQKLLSARKISVQERNIYFICTAKISHLTYCSRCKISAMLMDQPQKRQCICFKFGELKRLQGTNELQRVKLLVTIQSSEDPEGVMWIAVLYAVLLCCTQGRKAVRQKTFTNTKFPCRLERKKKKSMREGGGSNPEVKIIARNKEQSYLAFQTGLLFTAFQIYQQNQKSSSYSSICFGFFFPKGDHPDGL